MAMEPAPAIFRPRERAPVRFPRIRDTRANGIVSFKMRKLFWLSFMFVSVDGVLSLLQARFIANPQQQRDRIIGNMHHDCAISIRATHQLFKPGLRTNGRPTSAICSVVIPESSEHVIAVDPRVLAASASAALTYLSLVAFFDRPRGYLAISNPQSTLAVQPSRVVNGGLGLFVTRSLPKGTVLGTYPGKYLQCKLSSKYTRKLNAALSRKNLWPGFLGVLRPAQTFYDGKCRQYPQAVGYSWRFTDSKFVIDPTDDQGKISDVCIGGSTEVPMSNAIFGTLFRFLQVDTMLCRINEPPIGAGGCSVSARENLDRREVVFELIQDVYSGQELYLDYGLDYDRSGYAPRI
ncbi:hypothetical protein ACHAWF_004950 [Thalassiosira exigua]